MEEDVDEDNEFLKLMEQDLRKRMNRGRGDEVENDKGVRVEMMEIKEMREGEGEMNGRDNEKEELKDGEKEDSEGRKGDEEEGEREQREGVEVEEIEQKSHRGPRKEPHCHCS